MRAHGWIVGAMVWSAAASAAMWPPASGRAFCGFYVSSGSGELLNNATQVALMRNGLRTVLTMQNAYQGPPQDFAMVVPVPVVLQQENVRTLPHDVFRHLEELTAPRLVEYWEQDPCAPDVPTPDMVQMAPPTTATAEPSGGGGADLGVRIEAQFVVGEYQIVILSASQSTGLETWLRQNRYNIPQGAAAYLAPYVREQSKFFVARVDIQRVQRDPNGRARLSPLRFHYDADAFRLPVRLGLLNAPEKQDLIVYVLHPQNRFEVANYPNVFIPTNLEVANAARERFPAFYAALFDATMRAAGGRAVVTEYSWQTSGCDPCPTPPLEPAELTTLGLDALGPGSEQFQYGMNVTRLHTRYDRETLTEDLVFREAAPIVGGREHVVNQQTGALEEGARREEGGANNFQARYAIRHRWQGAVSCNSPRRGVWGGPPGGGAPPQPQPARDLANAPRGSVSLGDVLLTPVPGIQTSTDVQHGAAGSITSPELMAAGRGPRGCNCSVAGAGQSLALGLGALATTGLVAAGCWRVVRRRRRR
ncbi:MAG: DUF2330 domain-containing protein [Deltaproteobacteria bacterium]|nr:DUF2330 domain-containing protein [Deltaproteobacteria bacterium]